jgi:hypothetical protein
MENMENWGYLRYTKSSPKTPKLFKRIRRVRVHGEDAKKLLAYSPNTPKDIYVCIFRLILMRILNFFIFFPYPLYGMD